MLLLLLCAEVHRRLAGWACHGSCSRLGPCRKDTAEHQWPFIQDP